jgi:hypothetical protein
MNAEQTILRILESGGIIRKIDGRYKDSFVDMKALQKLIDDGRAEVYKLQGMDFVRLAATTAA